ncbi:hypothetical protein [Wenyingzhuangia sp. IMCC45467]
MMKNDGKYFEQLVAIIEKSLDKDATIETDVQMPILNSIKGFTTQCDIVIKKGKKPRITTTIIEVQDRKTKVKPNDLRGWEQKLDDIGAQHLICVSRQKFPESTKEKALLSGNKISLINLSDTDVEKIPLNFFKYSFTSRDFKIIKSSFIKLYTPDNSSIQKELNDFVTNQKFKINDKIFYCKTSGNISYYDIAYEAVKENINIQNKKKTLIKKYIEDGLKIYLNGKFIPIGLNTEFTYSNITKSTPAYLMSYEENEFGVLAWLLKSKYKIGNDFVDISIPVIPSGNGYKIENMAINTKGTTSFDIGLNVIKN